VHGKVRTLVGEEGQVQQEEKRNVMPVEVDEDLQGQRALARLQQGVLSIHCVDALLCGVVVDY